VLLDCGFADLDDEICKSSGLSPGDYIRNLGEFSFRQQEFITLRKLLTAPPKIIALGGGTLHVDGVLDVLQGKCVVVLESSYEKILERIGKTDRPLAKMGKALYEKRNLLFQTMPLTIDTTELSISQCGLKIYDLWKAHENI
jgi:shikimate kinase